MFLTFLLSPLGRKLAVGVLVVALVTGLCWHIYGRGKDAGKQEGVASQLDVDRQQMEKERVEFQKTLQASQAREQSAIQLIAKYQTLLDQASAALSAVKVQRQDAQVKVAAVPDSALQQDIVARLAIRPATDTTPTLYSSELRKLDGILSDYPLVQQEIKLQDAKLTALEGKVEGLGTQVKAIQDERDSWKGLAKQMQGHYQRAYNAIPRRGNFFLRVVSLGFAGRAKKLDLPDPEKLLPHE